MVSLEEKLKKEINMGRFDAYSEPVDIEEQAEVEVPMDVPASLQEGSVTQTALSKVEAETYDTLYANAETSSEKFKGKQVSTMTLDELVEFSKPRGEYGKWVKPRLGKDTIARKKGLTSTPMGKYQIVGTTLRNIMKQMDLSGDTVFNKDTQDKMFLFLAKDAIKRGSTEAQKIANLRAVWEGFKNISNADIKKMITEIG